MTTGLMIVESRSQSPDGAAEYRKWYEEIHGNRLADEPRQAERLTQVVELGPNQELQRR